MNGKEHKIPLSVIEDVLKDIIKNEPPPPVIFFNEIKITKEDIRNHFETNNVKINIDND